MDKANIKEVIINKANIKLLIAFLILIGLALLSLMVGAKDMTLTETIQSLFFIGDSTNIKVVYKLRLPRVLAAISAGALLSTSGYFSRIALKNSLADSSILGVQTGSTAFAMYIMLVAPAFMYIFLPLFAFLGGFLAFILVVLFSSNNKKITSTNIVLAGVAVNAFFSALIGIITVTHAKELEKTINFINGSLISLTLDQAKLMFKITILLMIISFLFMPMLNILKLDDDNITALGKNVNLYKVIICAFAVLLASTSIIYVGIIGFVGIIAPEIAKIILKKETQYYQIFTIIIGASLILLADTAQRVIFAPNEIPVGVVLGFVGAPLFLYLLKRGKNV